MTELSRSFPKVSLYLILHEHLVNFSRNITIDWIDSNKQRNFTLWNQFRIDLNKTIGIRKKRKLFEVSFSDTSRSSFRCKKKSRNVWFASQKTSSQLHDDSVSFSDYPSYPLLTSQQETRCISTAIIKSREPPLDGS